MELPNFGINSGPYLTYGAKSGRWKFVKEKNKTDITLGEVICDLENYATGWGAMAEGQAPQWKLNSNRAVFGPIPSDAKDKDGKPLWKQGIKVTFFSPSTFGGDGVCSFDTTGFGARQGIFELLKKYSVHPERKDGLVPVVKFTGTITHGTGQKETTIPQFEIVKFVPRPAALSGQAAPVAAANQSVVTPPDQAVAGEF